MSYKLFCMGDPLLDVQVHDNDLLTRYDLQPNGAILAEEKHMPLSVLSRHEWYEEMFIFSDTTRLRSIQMLDTLRAGVRRRRRAGLQ